MIDALLPWPPTSNSMLTVWRGRKIASERYKQWISEARIGMQLQRQRPVKGPVEILIQLSSPTRRIYDLDNRIKPILDLLVGLDLIESDDMNTVTRIVVEKGEGFTGAWILVTTTEERSIRETKASHAEQEEGLHPFSEMEA